MWKGWWSMWREDGGCGGSVLDVEGRSVWGCSISQYDLISAIFLCIALIFLHAPIFHSIISFWMWMGGWWMWRDGGCGLRVDLEGGWMWRNRQSVECSISQYDHISVIFHCIAPIFCMHPYFLKI